MEKEKTIISIQDVSVRFNIASERIDNLKEYFIKLLKRELMFKEFLALKDVSLDIKKGEAWGFIGVNGSGKSTILKAISGILKPYKGKISVSGTIAPLIELGAGFDYDLTARENIFLNGAVLGHNEKFMKEHFDEIVEFAELENFLDMPIKNYSSGMAARLGFAIATMAKADILICDEVLAVGDYAFQKKCEDRMKALLDGGTTLLYVSHSVESVRRLCDHAIWLDHGQTIMKGSAIEVCDEYIKSLNGVIEERKEGEKVEYIVIQAGGKGTRLKNLTKNKPKGIVPVNNLPIIFHMFRKYPDKKYIIIGDYKHEVLEKYLEAFGFTNTITVKAKGHGTCAGIKEALKYIPKESRFMLMWSDLILDKQLDIDSTEGNLVGISEDFECRWSFKNDKFVEEASKKDGVAGLFIFDNKEIIEKVPDEGEFVRWLGEQSIDFKRLALQRTKETGTLQAIEELSAKSSEYRCRAFNTIERKGDLLVKRPLDDQGRELATREVKWYKEVSKYKFENIPKIYEYDPIVMEKIDGENIYKADLNFEDKKKVVDNIVKTLNKLHKLKKDELNPYSIMDTYFYKTFNRLSKVRDLIPFANEKEIIINSKVCRNPYFYKDYIMKLVKDLCLETCENFALIHGDCTFSNMMVDKKGDIILLDPRGYFGDTELYGDEYYDWAKVYYSLYGDYDRFNIGKFSLDIKEKDIEFTIESNNFKELADYFLQLIPNVNIKKIKFIHILIWLSLTTYAWEDYDSICGAFYNGTQLFEEFLKEFE